MKIVIDGRMLYWTGVGRYTKELLNNLEEIDHENEYVVLVRDKDWAMWEPTAKNFSKMRTSIDPYTLSEQIKLPRVLRKLRPDLVHFTAPNTPLLYRGRRVVNLHDLTLVDFDTSRGMGVMRSLRSMKRLPFRLVMWNDAKFATGLLALTEYVKAEIVKRYSVDLTKVTVAMPAADMPVVEGEPLERFRIQGDFLLYVGNFYPYKNVDVIVNAFAQLLPHYPKLKLVIAGKPDYFRDDLEAKAHLLGISDKVIFTGFVSDGELASLYKEAILYVNPSLSEGFGLQGLEAMTAGLPVVAARASCLPEVYADAAVYFDPHSSTDLARVASELLDSAKQRQEMSSRGLERVKQFSWLSMAIKTLEAYKRAMAA